MAKACEVQNLGRQPFITALPVTVRAAALPEFLISTGKYTDMSLLDETIEVPRRTMTIFFIVDTSGRMSGSKIGAINESIQELLPMIRDISAFNPDAEIKVAALQFSRGAKWVGDEPKSADDFVWDDLSAEGASSDLGKACRELSSKLSLRGFMKSASGSYAPAIILLSGGRPTDDFESGLEVLKRNSWFRVAIKIAIAIGDDADQGKLAKFTGTRETVLTVHNIDVLKKLIRLVAVTSSQLDQPVRKSNEGLFHDGNKSDTKLHHVLKRILRQFGSAVLQDERLLSLLDDYHAFDDYPAMRQVMKEFESRGYLRDLYCRSQKDGIAECQLYADYVKKSLAQTRHVRAEFADYAVESVFFALGLVDSVSEPADDDYELWD